MTDSPTRFVAFLWGVMKQLKPDASNDRKDALCLRELIKEAGLTQRGAALLVGLPERTTRDYLNPAKENSVAPYSVQFCLECLVAADTRISGSRTF